MNKFLLSLVLFGAVAIRAQDDDDHDHDHEGEGDCECASGYDNNLLAESCDDAPITQIQDYIRENDCQQYCHDHDGELEYHGSGEAAWRCFQTYTLWIQYHNYCPSGAVNETFFHDYLDVCPYCHQDHYIIEGAPDCDESLSCTNETNQIEAIQFVNSTCISTCTDALCEETWREVEGYHRLCDHDELSVEFDTIFDNLAFEETACTDIYCNVPEEEDHVVNCSANSSTVNYEWYQYLLEYGQLDVDEEILGESAAKALVTVCAVALSFAAVAFV